MTPTDSSQPSFQINPLSTVMAAEVTGLNLGSASQQDMEQLHRAFLDYHLVVVRNQSITARAHNRQRGQRRQALEFTVTQIQLPMAQRQSLPTGTVFDDHAIWIGDPACRW